MVPAFDGSHIIDRVNEFAPGGQYFRIALPALQEALDANKLTNWRDFVRIVKEAIEADEGGKMSVYKCGTWAVCKEYLGELATEDELWYTAGRAGIWSSNKTTREVIEDLQQKFPE